MAKDSKKSKSAKSESQKAKSESSRKSSKEKPEAASKSESGLFEQLGAHLRSAGAKAEELGKRGGAQMEKYARLGLAKAEMEKEKLVLYGAFADLGKAAAGCWERAPGTPLQDSQPEVATPLAKIRTLQIKLDGIQKHMDAINRGE